MKTKFKTFFFIILFPSLILAQKPLTKEQILEDYQILKNVLTKGHPALYEYTSRSEWDSLFTNFEEDKLQYIQNNNDLYSSLTELTDYVRDGHLIVMRPKLDSIPDLFPILLKIINEKFYTDTDDFGIPVGSEISSIDGISASDVREQLLSYAPSDGFNTSKKDRQLEREFGILHFYEFGPKPTYQVAYKTPSGQLSTKEVKSQPFESIGKRFGKRNSYAGNKNLGRKEPFLHFIDSLSTAVVTINTFSMDVEKFRSTLKDIFKEVRRKKGQNLIIDVRQNEGGYPLNAICAFSYLATKPFKQRVSSEVIAASLPEKAYSQNLVNGYTYESFFRKYYEHAEKKGNHWLLRDDENEPLMIPNKKKFEGKAYVLIGGKTFSAGSSFALFCKNEGIQLVGEETGGGCYTQTGGYPIIYTLPNSEIKILIPFVKINRYVKDNSQEKGRGIMPDKRVALSVEDLIHRRDTQLDYILKEIDDEQK